MWRSKYGEWRASARYARARGSAGSPRTRPRRRRPGRCSDPDDCDRRVLRRAAPTPPPLRRRRRGRASPAGPRGACRLRRMVAPDRRLTEDGPHPSWAASVLVVSPATAAKRAAMTSRGGGCASAWRTRSRRTRRRWRAGRAGRRGRRAPRRRRGRAACRRRRTCRSGRPRCRRRRPAWAAARPRGRASRRGRRSPIGGAPPPKAWNDAGERGDVERVVGDGAVDQQGSRWRSSSTRRAHAAVHEAPQPPQRADEPAAAARSAGGPGVDDGQHDHDRGAEAREQRRQRATSSGRRRGRRQHAGERRSRRSHRARDQEQRGVAAGRELGGHAEPGQHERAERGPPAPPAGTSTFAPCSASPSTSARRQGITRSNTDHSARTNPSIDIRAAQRGGHEPPRVRGREAVADLADAGQREDQHDRGHQQQDEEAPALDDRAEVDGPSCGCARPPSMPERLAGSAHMRAGTVMPSSPEPGLEGRRR